MTGSDCQCALAPVFGPGPQPSMVFVSVVFGRRGAGLRGLLPKGAAVVVIASGVAIVMQAVRVFDIVRRLPNW